MSLPAPMLARAIKLELFEQSTVVLLQAELEEWLESRAEETIIDISFDGDVGSFRAYVLYTE